MAMACTMTSARPGVRTAAPLRPLPPRRPSSARPAHIGGLPTLSARRAPPPPASVPISLSGDGGGNDGRIPPRDGTGKATAEEGDWEDDSQDAVSATATKIIARVRSCFFQGVPAGLRA
jgi:hypothetical protein